jgi:hypothetical protein
MGQGTRIGVVLGILSVAAVLAATGAFAATPQDIYRDYADNGRLDGTYSLADLERTLKDAAVQQYGQPATGGLKPAIEEEQNETTVAGTAGGTSGGTSGGTAAGNAASGTPPVQSSGGLPFTGLDLGLIAVGAFGLIFLGAALWRVARQRA